METARRTLAKTVSWQILGIIVMTAIGTIATGTLGQGFRLAIGSMGVGIVTYVLHERVWSRIAWGRAPASPAQTAMLGAAPNTDP